LTKNAIGRARAVGGINLLDPEMNKIIPLLAPIEETFEDETKAAVASSTASEHVSQFEQLILQALGDLRDRPLDLPTVGQLGLELTSCPLRTSSTISTDDSSVVKIPESDAALVQFYCVYPHRSRSDDEVSLQYGDVVTVR
ncbi:hypothetical protein HK405_001774, partial [Cladochytrium tenue]